MSSKILSSAFNFFKDTIYDLTCKDAAKMLICMGAVGFALSSLAQCFAIQINNKIDKRKKRFLLRQEAADGAVNIGLFLAITSSIWKVSDKLLTKIGVLNTTKNLDQVKSGGRILTTAIASVISCNIITPYVRNFIAGKITAYKDKKEQDLRTIDINNKLKITPFSDFNNWKCNSSINKKINLQKVIPAFNRNYGSVLLKI